MHPLLLEPINSATMVLRYAISFSWPFQFEELPPLNAKELHTEPGHRFFTYVSFAYNSRGISVYILSKK